jgi:uncharacterized iron-regulated protein
LEEYLQGQISWTEFARRTGFERGWGRTSPAYRKILSLCRRKGIPVIALNAPEVVARKLARGEPLTGREEQFSPKYPEPPGGFQEFSKAMGGHHSAVRSLRRYYKAQRAWDQAMAARVLEWLQNHSATLFVILGRYHADPHTGVPWYVARKSRASQLILLPAQERKH